MLTRTALLIGLCVTAPALAAPPADSLRLTKSGSTLHLTWTRGTGPYGIYRSPVPGDVLRPAWMVGATQQLYYDEPLSASTGMMRYYLVDDPKLCATAADCDDHFSCTGTETCDSRSRLCAAGARVVCDDGDACTEDRCEEPTGHCAYQARNCDDGSSCTIDACRQEYGCTASIDPGAGLGTAAQLAGHSLAVFPWFKFVSAFNHGTPVEVAVDPFRHPGLVGRTCDVYVVAARGATGWCGNALLADVRGAPDTLTIVPGGIRQNTLTLTGSAALSADAGTGIGVGYDVVLDCNRDGFLDGDDLADGLEGDAGFYTVADITVAGPLAVTQFDDIGPESPHCSGGGLDDMRIYYPSVLNDSSYTGKFPLVVISHGNGHCYDWYDFLGTHLASYGYIVMAHDNNTGPGIETASTTTLTFTDKILTKQSTLHGGVLDGHIDSHHIAWIGHSRGGEGVARAYDRLVDEGYKPSAYAAEDIVVISSIAPTDFLGPAQSNPHAVPYHLLYGSADGDVCGCPNNSVAQSFGVYERATGVRQSTYLHGADHNDFNCCGFDDFAGPADSRLGRPEAQTIQKAVQLALIEHFVSGSRAAEDFFTRHWEEFRPLGVAAADVVVTDRRDPLSRRVLVVDDYQTHPETTVSSSGGAVGATVTGLAEGRQVEADGAFNWTGTEPLNGMTRGRDADVGRGGVFQFTGGSSVYYDFSILPAARDFTAATWLSFRAAQITRHPETIAELADVTFTVTLIDAGGARGSIAIGPYSGGIEEPYQRTGYGDGTGWQNEFQAIRLRVADFARDGSALDLTNIVAVRFEFSSAFGSSRGALGIDDIELVKE